MPTKNLNLNELSANHTLAYVTINQAFNILDTFVQLRVESQTVTTPPSHVSGNAWIVGIGATGDWAGKDGQIAISYNSAWFFIPPNLGMQCYDKALGAFFRYSGSVWLVYAGATVESMPPFLADDFINQSGAIYVTHTFTNFNSPYWALSLSSDTSIVLPGFALPKHGDYQNVNLLLNWWTSAIGSGDVVWDISIYNAEDGDDVDLSTVANTQFTETVSTGTQEVHQTTLPAELDLNSEVTEKSLLHLKVERLGSDVADTFNQQTRIMSAVLQYNRKATLDQPW